MFDKNFKFGFSECGFQFEMGLSDEDKNSDWYAWANSKNNAQNHYVSGDLPQNGVAYWDMYPIDHENARNLGMNSGRLSVEWSRIFPESTESVYADSIIENGDVKKVIITMDMLEKLDKIAIQAAISHYSDIFSDFKSRCPFKIIRQCPVKVTLDLKTIFNSPFNIAQMRRNIIRPVFVSLIG